MGVGRGHRWAFPSSQPQILPSHTSRDRGQRSTRLPSGPGQHAPSLRAPGVDPVQWMDQGAANYTPPPFNPPETLSHHSPEKMNPGRSHKAAHWRLTNDSTFFYFLWGEVFIQLHPHIFFFFLHRIPPSNSGTHPPSRISLLARCPTRCHLKVRESSKVEASLLYLREYLPFGWALLS